LIRQRAAVIIQRALRPFLWANAARYAIVFARQLRSKEHRLQASFDDFMKIDMRVGIIREVLEFPRARKPAYKVRVDFGAEVGEKWSSAQVTHYGMDALIGRRVIGVVNFTPKNIGGFMSECLILGVPDSDGNVILLQPDKDALLGGRVY
jgi:tRNA-binding protein